MERRNFINTLLSASFGLGIGSTSHLEIPARSKRQILQKNTFAVDDNRISYYLNELTTPLKIFQISDTHLWMDDYRGEQFMQYSKRMAGAYHTRNHFKTGEVTNPKESFEEVLKMAIKQNVDLFAMTGDIFSFPSEAAIEWVYEKISEAGIPYLFVSGNHDWHYEGMEGSREKLRDIWTNKRLSLLYQGNDPLMASYTIKGIKVIAIDNSTYEILPEQLEFFRRHVRGNEPVILMMHIPMYAPGRSMGYGCGNPGWGAASDRGYETERRERWPVEGHTKITMDFYREVFSSPNLLGIFTGHVHRQSMDLVEGIPQFTANGNFMGAYIEIDFLPLE